MLTNRAYISGISIKSCCLVGGSRPLIHGYMYMERPLRPLVYKTKENMMTSSVDAFGHERPLKPIKLKTNNTKENTESKKEEQVKITIHIDNINIYLNKD